jgi:hypothetical protein
MPTRYAVMRTASILGRDGGGAFNERHLVAKWASRGGGR